MLVNEKMIFPSHTSMRKAPENINDEDQKLFKHEYESDICETRILDLRNVDVLDDTIFDSSNFSFFPEYTHINGFFSFRDKLEKLKLFFSKKTICPQAVWITQNWTWMYFHWITDALTRLISVENEITNFPVLLPIEYKKYPFVIESLEILGYEYCFYDTNNRVRVKKMILISHTALPGNYNKFFLNKLRDKFISISTIKKPFRKIYITRQNASQRFIINEKEVIEKLLYYGFEIHAFEDYTLRDQILLMNETCFLVGLHGAGLTNMLFMNAGGKVLELRNQGDYENNCYFSMASELNHLYYYLQCKGDDFNTSSVNVYVYVNELENIIKFIY
jgi:capsular polysaccharide biosynthesis protein